MVWLARLALLIVLAGGVVGWPAQALAEPESWTWNSLGNPSSSGTTSLAIPRSALIPKTLAGASDSDFLVRLGSGGFVRGSSVTGASARTGAPFGPESDIDFYVESGQLTNGMRTSASIPGFVHPDRIAARFPELQKWADRWSVQLGRSVSVGGFVPGTVP